MAGGAGRTGSSPLPPSSGGSRGPRNQGVPGSPAQSWLPLTCPVPELLAPVSAWSSLPPPGAWGRPDSSRQSPKSPTDRPEREDGVTEALPPRARGLAALGPFRLPPRAHEDPWVGSRLLLGPGNSDHPGRGREGGQPGGNPGGCGGRKGVTGSQRRKAGGEVEQRNRREKSESGRGEGSYCLISTEFYFWRMNKILQMDGSDGAQCDCI